MAEELGLGWDTRERVAMSRTEQRALRWAEDFLNTRPRVCLVLEAVSGRGGVRGLLPGAGAVGRGQAGADVGGGEGAGVGAQQVRGGRQVVGAGVPYGGGGVRLGKPLGKACGRGGGVVRRAGWVGAGAGKDDAGPHGPRYGVGSLPPRTY